MVRCWQDAGSAAVQPACASRLGQVVPQVAGPTSPHTARKQRARSLSPGVRRIGGGFAYCAPPGPGSTGDTALRHGPRSAPRLRYVTADCCRSMLLTQIQRGSPSQLLACTTPS